MVACVALVLLTGRLIALDGGRITDTHVVVHWSAQAAVAPVADTLLIDAEGRFGGLARDVGGDSITITVRPGLDSRYYPMQVVVSRRRLGDEMRVMLVPKRWPIVRGRYAGLEVPIDPAAAVRRVPSYGSFGRVTHARTVGWVPGSFPLPVVLPRDDGQRISPTDSIAFWTAARELEEAMGRQLFQPTADTAMRGRIFPVDIRIDRRISTSGLTFVSWDSEGNIFEASVRFHSSLEIRSRGTVQHELMHVLGFGHATQWLSATEARSGLSRFVTAEDVAYAQLMMRAHEVEEDPLLVGRFTAVGQGIGLAP